MTHLSERISGLYHIDSRNILDAILANLGQTLVTVMD